MQGLAGEQGGMERSLAEVRDRKVMIVRVEAGSGLTSRLLAMGLVPGVHVDVISNPKGCGPLVLGINGSRLIIGKGAAEKIRVA